jgi:molecular chaperone DnaK
MAVVGIDLGTTNTVVASVKSGRVQVLADERGRRLLPSVVSFHPNGEVLVGHEAKQRRLVDAENTVASVKRLIGRAWNSEELDRARQRFSFALKEGRDHAPLVVVRGHEYTLPEISAFVLTRAKQIAERALGEKVDRAVVTVPANFNELQRAATKVAARVAGLDVTRIINEPTAAALAYGLGRSSKERIAVYDFGGGTFDCTLLDLSGNVFEVLATAGDSFLGGDDLDIAIAERIADAFLRTHRADARVDVQAFERLRAAAETVKIELSTNERTHTKLRDVMFGAGGARLDLDFGMGRDELEALAAPLVERTFAVCEEALSVARLPVASFDKVILVGGSTRVPLVRRRVEEFFGTQPLDRVNADEVVGIGAAIQAAALTETARRQSIPPAPLPASRRSHPPETDDDAVTIATRLPAKLAEQEKMRPPAASPPANARRSAKPASLPNASDALLPALPSITPTLTLPLPSGPAKAQPSSGPEAVAPPAQARASSLPSPIPDPAETIPRPVSYQDILRSTLPPESAAALPKTPVLVDVTPRALVVETVGGWCDVVVQRNAKIPCERTRAFATSSDMQTTVRVRVAQGEDAQFEKNTFLGEVELVGLRAAPRGEVTIRARFDVDESGTLKVFATDVATGREAHALLQLVGIAEALSVDGMRERHAATKIG